MTRGKKVLFRWMLAAVTAGTFLGGIASAELPECMRLYACGCSSDGGYIYCTTSC